MRLTKGNAAGYYWLTCKNRTMKTNTTTAIKTASGYIDIAPTDDRLTIKLIATPAALAELTAQYPVFSDEMTSLGNGEWEIEAQIFADVASHITLLIANESK